jgi:hypothetical protein
MIQFPSFEEVAQSPPRPDLGVAVALGGAWFERGAPVTLYGSFAADDAFHARCHGQPLAWITVIAIGRHVPDVWVESVIERRRLAPPPTDERAAPSPTFRVGGYFNLDLRQHLGLPDEPGRYWLLVSMGDYLTDRMAFELR